MTAVPVKEEHAALVSQCLDFCQTLATKSLTFSFNLTLGDSFSFSLDTNGKEALAAKAKKKKKKKTPSTLRRDAKRRSEFLKKKLEVSSGDTSSQRVSEEESAGEQVERVVDEKVFKCDQCQNTFKTENGLKIHVGKAHKKVNQVQATPEQLRQRPEGSMNISTSPLLDASREEPCLNTDTSEEIEEPTPPRQPPPSTPPPSKPSPSPPVILKKPVRMLNGDPVFVKRK